MWLFIESISACKAPLFCIRSAFYRFPFSISLFKYIILSSRDLIFDSTSFRVPISWIFWRPSTSALYWRSLFSSLYFCSNPFMCESSETKFCFCAFNWLISRSQSYSCCSFCFNCCDLCSTADCRSVLYYKAFWCSYSNANTYSFSTSPCDLECSHEWCNLSISARSLAFLCFIKCNSSSSYAFYCAHV